MNTKAPLIALAVALSTFMTWLMAQTLDVHDAVRIFPGLTNTTVTMSGRAELRITGVGHRTADAADKPGGTPATLTVNYLPEIPLGTYARWVPAIPTSALSLMIRTLTATRIYSNTLSASTRPCPTTARSQWWWTARHSISLIPVPQPSPM